MSTSKKARAALTLALLIPVLTGVHPAAQAHTVRHGGTIAGGWGQRIAQAGRSTEPKTTSRVRDFGNC